MQRNYSRIVDEGWDESGRIISSIAWKTYYLEDGAIGRIDYFDSERGLFKVSHRNLDPPYDDVVDSHFLLHPEVMCEFASRPVSTPEGTSVLHTCLYQPGKELERRYEVHLDERGRTLRQIRYAPDGTWLREERPIYNDRGEEIGCGIHDRAGKKKYELMDDD